MNKAQYLQELGVVNFEFNQKSNLSVNNQSITPKTIDTKLLIIEHKTKQPLSTDNPNRQFLAKMLAAIEVDIKDVYCDFVENIEKYNAKIIIFAGDFSDNIQQKFIIPNPSEILKDHSLKREAWEVLKKIKDEYNK